MDGRFPPPDDVRPSGADPASPVGAANGAQAQEGPQRPCEMSLKFGTDGVRGVANTELTPELVLALGRAAARVLGGGTFLVGRDTRMSGPMLQAALTAGLESAGADVA